MLKNLDGTYIQPLTYAFDISAELHYNETSQLEFSIPAYANGEETPHYKDIVGMRIVDWLGVGQFILVNPSTENDGVKEIKKCKAYSLEYELTYKSTYIPEGTYEFWNPVAPESTIIGMILSDYPSWSVGSIDSDLIGVYRTFDANSQNAYDLMKNELQEKYQCVFDFDTYNRAVNVRKVSSIVEQKPVYLSTKNLIKNISVEEDTENIFTAMDVNGAEGVDIRSVNPMGNNVIYNLDYFMYQTPEEVAADSGNSYFSQEMINKWAEWKERYTSSQRQFYNITIDKVLKEAKLETAKAELTELNGELSTLTELQSTYVEAEAQSKKDNDIDKLKSDYSDAADDWNAMNNGNVDYHKRPWVTASQMFNAGWNSQRDHELLDDADGINTYSQGYLGADFRNDGCHQNNLEKYIEVTPILDSGEILSPQELEDYVWEIFQKPNILSADKPSNGGYGIIVSVFDNPQTGYHYEAYEKQMLNASYESGWLYELYNDWDVDYDTGEIILGRKENRHVQDSVGWFTAGGKLIDEILSDSVYKYVQYDKKKVLGGGGGLSPATEQELEEYFDDLQVIKDRSVDIADQLKDAQRQADLTTVDFTDELDDIKKKIAEKEKEIADKEDEIKDIKSGIDDDAETQEEIVEYCQFDNVFDSDELIVLDRYFKDTSISEPSFVYSEVKAYADDDTVYSMPEATIEIENAVISGTKSSSGNVVFMISGGSLLVEDDDILFSGDIVRASFEKRKNDGDDDTYMFTAYLADGAVISADDVTFDGGGLTSYGTIASFETDAETPDEIEALTYIEGTYISATVTGNSLCFTRNVGEYEKRSIEWSLLEFGEHELETLAWPSYSFDVDSANFLALEDFAAFKNKFALGDKIYIDVNGKILTPIAIGVQVDFSNPSKFKLMFGDKYSLKDSAFELVDLLEQSVQMGKTVATNKLSYNAFIDSGASTAVKDYMTSALDASKQAVISGAGQSIQFDGSGLRLRKAIDGGYDDEQIWMINNNIVFTDDGWSSAKMAIGKFEDENAGESWGIVAPNIVGTLLAGENLIIESAKKDGSTSVFRVDADGAKLYNSNFDLVKSLGEGTNSNAWIKFDPNLGMIGGLDSIANPLYEYDDDGNVIGIKSASGNALEKIPSTITEDNMPNASFWLDMNGNAFYKGTVYAEDGVFRGDVYADNGTFKGTVDATTFKLDGVDISNIFKTEEDPELGDVLKIGQITIDGTTGTISWDNVSTSPIGYMYNSTASDSGAHSDMRSTDYYRKEKFGGAGTWSAWYQFRGKDGSDGEDFSGYDWIKQTYIDGSSVKSPTMMANQVYVSNHFAVGTVDGSDYTTKGYMGYATGKIPGDIITEGIAISTEPDLITYETSGHYLIVTTDGVRMQAPGHCIFVTSGGAFYDNEPLGVARFG